MTVTIDYAALDAWANNPNGQIAAEVAFVAANDVYWVVKDALNQPASFSRSPRGWITWQPNPEPGPPLQRTGRLWASVDTTRPKRDAEGVHCDITVQSTPRFREDANGNVSFDDFDYVNHLIQRGYVFVHSNDPRFKIVERGPGQ